MLWLKQMYQEKNFKFGALQHDFDVVSNIIF